METTSLFISMFLGFFRGDNFWEKILNYVILVEILNVLHLN